MLRILISLGVTGGVNLRIDGGIFLLFVDGAGNHRSDARNAQRTALLS
jgi:hypothetical protein